MSEQDKELAEFEWEHHAKKLIKFLYCMSYNDSYFGEPVGLVKRVTSELNRLIGTGNNDASTTRIAELEAEVARLRAAGQRSLDWLASYPGGGANGCLLQMREAMKGGSVCSYPDCNCPFDAPADPEWCARGLPHKAKGGAL